MIRIKYINVYYTEKYKDTLSYPKLNKSLTYVYISDSLDFHNSLLIIFRVLIKAYYNSVTELIQQNYGESLCQLDNSKTNMIINTLHLNVLVGNFDIRSYNYEEELEKERQKEKINISTEID